MTSAVADLLAILDLEQLEHNLYRGLSPQDGWRRVYGGQVLGQALVAASRTVAAERPAHSLHAYFLRPGDPAIPIVYEVDRIRDGKSFTTRRVVGVQRGEAIFSMSASFQVREDGLEHRADMPEAPAPDLLVPESGLPEPVKAFWRRDRPIEIRPVDPKPYVSRESLEPEQRLWFRVSSRLPDDPAAHACALAYASDMTLLDTSLFPHGRSVFDRDVQVASLDHAMWFHRPFRADEWLLYAQDSPNAGGARGFSRGAIFRQDGVLAASVAQEGLIRLRGGGEGQA